MKTLYTAHVTSIGGRDGKVESDDKRLSMSLTRPGASSGTNPEQLFAAGYSACFASAAGQVAKSKNIDVTEVKVEAEVALNHDDSGYFLSVVLNVTLNGIDAAKAQEIVNEAHQMCPYSKATRGNINVDLKVAGQPIAAEAA